MENLSKSCVVIFFFQPDPYLPFEFTHEGMLERVNALVQNQVIVEKAIFYLLLSPKLIARNGGSSRVASHYNSYFCPLSVLLSAMV